jgi:hypothetical protein
LPAMVALVRYEIREHMADVQREIAPSVGRRRGYLATLGAPKAQKVLDGCGTVAKGPDEIRLADRSPVHRVWDPNAEWLSKSSNPQAARIVDMARDHPGCATGRARDDLVPEPGRETGKEQAGHSGVGLPGGQDDLFEAGCRRHWHHGRRSARSRTGS